jgi:serine/threonine protein kinase
LDPSAPVAGSAPAYLVHPCNISALTERLLLNRILLIDFGASFFFDAAPTDIRAPAQYTPPEVLYGTGIVTPAIDQWTLGCLLFEICAGYTLFKMLFNPQTDVLKDLVSMMGKPPEWMWELWEERKRYFHNDGSPITGTKGIEVVPYSLYSRIEDMARLYINGDYASEGQGREPENVLTQELEDMYDLLRQLLVYEQELRLSIEKCLEHPFLAGSERV